MKNDSIIPDWLRRLSTQQQDQLNRWQRTVRFIADLSRHCARELANDKAGQMAAALTYYTLFSLLPTLVLMLVVMQNFISEDQREQFKENLVNTILAPIHSQPAGAGQDDNQAPPPEVGLLPVQPDESIPERADTDRQEVQEDQAAVIARRKEFEAARDQIARNIDQLMDQLEQINFRGIGAVGVLLFIWGATGLLATIERSFNIVYGVSHGRPWYMRIFIYYTVITLGPIVIFAGQLLQRGLFQTIEAGAWTNWLTAPLGALMPIITVWLVLYVMFVTLPVAKVSLRYAAIGSMVSSVAWAAGIELFSVYVARAAISSLYGALALLPLLLLWLYVTWLIVLFGLEVTYTLQAMRGRKFKHEQDRKEQPLIESEWLIPVACHIARRFAEGKLTDTQAIARQTNLPPRAVERLSEILLGAGIINQVDRGQESGYALARPADQITAERLLDIGREGLAPPTGTRQSPEWRFLDDLHARQADPAVQTSLADLVRDGATDGSANSREQSH